MGIITIVILYYRTAMPNFITLNNIDKTRRSHLRYCLFIYLYSFCINLRFRFFFFLRSFLTVFFPIRKKEKRISLFHLMIFAFFPSFFGFFCFNTSLLNAGEETSWYWISTIQLLCILFFWEKWLILFTNEYAKEIRKKTGKSLWNFNEI